MTEAPLMTESESKIGVGFTRTVYRKVVWPFFKCKERESSPYFLHLFGNWFIQKRPFGNPIDAWDKIELENKKR